MKIRVFSLCLAAFLCAGYTAFAMSAEVEITGGRKYKSVRLVPQIYNNAGKNLADIRVKDADGNDVPYFINSYELHVGKDVWHYAMTLNNSFVKDEYYYADYVIDNIPDHDVTATSIKVETAAFGFAKRVELYGGYDNINWEKITEETLYRVDDSEKLAIAFSKPQKYTHYRFKLSNNLEKITFKNVRLEYSGNVVSKEYFSEALKADYTVTTTGSQTVIAIKHMRHIKVDAITIETDSVFKRYAALPGGERKLIYNLDFNQMRYTDTTLYAQGYASDGDVFAVTIINGDDKPIDIKGVSISYFADEIVFAAERRDIHQITFGVSDRTTPPSYDIARYKDMILSEGTDMLSVGAIDAQKAAEPSGRDYKMLFNIIISAVALLLAVLILQKLKKDKGEKKDEH